MADPLTRITASLKSDKIIPDIIPESAKFSPSVLFTILWPASATEVMLGSKIERQLTVEEPEIKIEPLLAPNIKVPEEMADSAKGGFEEASYTLVLTDPDAPSRADPKYGQWRHWVVSISLRSSDFRVFKNRQKHVDNWH